MRFDWEKKLLKLIIIKIIIMIKKNKWIKYPHSMFRRGCNVSSLQNKYFSIKTSK